MKNRLITCIFSLILLAVIASCGGSNPTDSIVDAAASDDATTFRVGKSTFTNGDHNIPIDTMIFLSFSEPISPNLLTRSSFVLTNGSGETQRLLLSHHSNDPETMIRISPQHGFTIGESYTLEISPDLRSAYGTLISGNLIFRFTIVDVVVIPDLTPPAVVSTTPAANKNSYFGEFVFITFSEELDVESVNTTNIQLFIGSGSEPAPAAVAYKSDTFLVTVTPETALPVEQDMRVVMTGIKDLLGNTVTTPITLTYITRFDNERPYVVDRYPALDETGVAVDAVITVEFNEPVEMSPDAAQGLIHFKDTSGYLPVNYRTEVDGTMLRIIPDTDFRFDETYRVTLPSMTDAKGNPLSAGEWEFSTTDYGQSIDIEYTVDAFTFDEEHMMFYGLNSELKKLIRVDVENKTLLNTVDLAYHPSDLCIDTQANRMFIVNAQSKFVTELMLDTLDVVTSFEWTAAGWNDPGWGDSAVGFNDLHFHIVCRPDALFLVDAATFGPFLWKVDRSDYSTVIDYSTVRNIGGLAFTDDGAHLYVSIQDTWTETLLTNKVVHYDYSGGNFGKLDESAIGYGETVPMPLNTPLFLDEAGARVILAAFVFNANNLTEVIHRFDEEDIIYAADFSGNRAAGKTKIFSLDTYEQTGVLPMRYPDHLFFDKNGHLFFMVNKFFKMYYMEL